MSNIFLLMVKLIVIFCGIFSAIALIVGLAKARKNNTKNVNIYKYLIYIAVLYGIFWMLRII
ncbi:MAG: hypothetical protein IKV94_04680 [Clostridia bacterium]|nr:hypothetical protein [Clostridia bacterium]